MTPGAARPLAASLLALSLAVTIASAVEPAAGPNAQDHRVPRVKQYATPRGFESRVTARNGEWWSDRKTESGELRVIVRGEGDPLILAPRSDRAALSALKEQRLAALDAIADAVVATDNDVRKKLGRTPLAPADLVGVRFTHVFNGFSARVRRESLESLRKLPGVTGVWVDQEVHAALAQSVPLIRADQVWSQYGDQGQGITVAVLDSGIDYTRPDLGGCLGPGCKVEYGKDLINQDSDPMDDFGHGTHVAGIVAANGTVKGVAPMARLWGIKVLDQYGNGLDSTIIAGIETATNPDGDPGTQDGARIINLSLAGAGNPDDPVSQAADNAMAGGTLVVAAAGNFGPDYDTIGSPACARQIVTVGASDKSDHLASFSARGPATTTYQIKPELVAPGVSITSTVPTGNCTYCDPSGLKSLDGTSMAAPHVAGTAALVLERYPAWTPAQVKAALMQKSIDLSAGAFVQGSGRIDALNAVSSFGRVDVPTVSPGWDDPGQPTFLRSQVVNITNLAISTRSYTLSVLGTLPPGVSATVSPASVMIPTGQTQSFTFTLNVNNAMVANVAAEPLAYEGTIRAVSGTEVLRIPFAFLKAPRLTLNFDQTPATVLLTDNHSWLKQYNYAPTSFGVLLPDVTLDVVTAFVDGVSTVFHEGLHPATSTQISISRSEAAYYFLVIPVDKNGGAMSLTTSLSLTHLGAKNGYFDTWSTSDNGNDPGSPTLFWFSPMSANYVFELSVLQEPGGTSPTYFYFGSTSTGIQGSMTFRNAAADFRHFTWGYKVDPGRSVVFPWTSMTTRPYGSNLVFSWGNCDVTPGTPSPFQRDVYLTPIPNSQIGTGFLRQSVFGAAPSGPCAFSDYLYDTPYAAATSASELDLWQLGKSDPAVRATGALLTSGVGPYRFAGVFQNDTGTLAAYGDPVSWFTSQLYDVRPYAPLPFEILQGGALLYTGALSGTDTRDPFQAAIAPGRYTMHIPFTQWYLGGSPGRADTYAVFDTQSADPNPPTLKSLTITHAGNFVDLAPASGATVSFKGGDDSGAIVDARLYYKTASGYLPAAVSGNMTSGYTATLPPAGGPPPAGPIAVILRDASGNAVTYSYCSAATATPEVCDGFDDDCDGNLMASEVDQDDDSWRPCAGDCNDADGSIWSAPGEVSGLKIDSGTEMVWGAPTGGKASAMTYDVLRSTDPHSFGAGATCVASDVGPSPTAIDGATPAPGVAFFYQVRAQDACPSGEGSLGAISGGAARTGRSCP